MKTEQLNPEQAEALDLRDGCVVAGAGAGKTRTLVAKIIHDQQTIDPADQIVVTFTNAAADEIMSRLDASGARKPGHVGTLHSLALRRVTAAWGGPLRVLDDKGYDQLIRETAKRTRMNQPVSTVRGWVMDPPRAGNGRLLVNGIIAGMRANRVIHADAMLSVYRDLLVARPMTQNVRVYVDEAQDSSPLDAAIYTAMTRSGQNRGSLIMFGDPRQAIYGFRGADPAIFIRALHGFATVELTANFRSARPIIDIANRIAGMMDLPIHPMTSGAGDIPGDVRARSPLAAGVGFSSTEAEVMDVRDQIRESTGSFAILTRYNAVANVAAAMLRAEGFSVQQPGREQLTDPAIVRIRELTELPKDWKAALAYLSVPFELQNRLLPALQRVADALEIGPAIDEALGRPADPEKTVWVSTIHGAKGLEWDNVRLIAADDLSLCMEDSEDVRLAYVAVTRARRTLAFSYARNRAGERRTDGLTASRILHG